MSILSSRCCLTVFAWLSVTANASFLPVNPKKVGHIRYMSFDGRGTSMEVLVRF